MSVQKNDIFSLGFHYLAYGDALDPEIVKKLIGDRKISLILTDMPYGVGYVENKAGFNQISKTKIIANDHEQTDAEYRSLHLHGSHSLLLFLPKRIATTFLIQTKWFLP